MTNKNLFALLSKPWANVKDIMIIADVGRDSAISIRDTISEEIIESGKKLPKAKRKIIPMQYLIKYMEMDLDYIAKMAKLENEIRKEEK